MTNNVTYEQLSPYAGALPQGTTFKTTETAGVHVQHVNVDTSTDSPLTASLVGNGVVSVLNSSTDPLEAGEQFVGTFESVLEYSAIHVSIHSDAASSTSSTDGLAFWFSKDGFNGFESDIYHIPANVCKTYTIQAGIGPFFKISYRNGATPQTSFSLCVQYKKLAGVASSHRIGDTITNEDDAQLVKAVLSAAKPDGTQTNIDATTGGNLKVSLEEIETGVVIPTTRDDDMYNDAFQRLRTSNTDQRFDAEFLYDKQPLLFDEILSGGGSAVFSTDSRDVVLTVGGTATTDGSALVQHWANVYTPGNSQFIAITTALNGANLAGTAAVFRRSRADGTVTEEVINQSSWLAATSGVNWNYSQILLMDFQSLKVGRVRFALDRAGLAVPVATIENDNERAIGYWQLANAPTFWKIYNTTDNTITEVGYGDTDNAIGFRYTSALDATQSVRAICTTVKSEGGGNLLDIAGIPFCASNGATTRQVTATPLPVLSVQLKTAFGAGTNRAIVIPGDVSFVTDYPLFYRIIINGTLTNASFNSVDANSICNFDVAATAITGGRVVACGYAGAGGTRAGTTGAGIKNKIPLSVNALGTVGDIITVEAVRVGTNNVAVGASLDWEEVGR